MFVQGKEGKEREAKENLGRRESGTWKRGGGGGGGKKEHKEKGRNKNWKDKREKQKNNEK